MQAYKLQASGVMRGLRVDFRNGRFMDRITDYANLL
jgi:hypothetical protein